MHPVIAEMIVTLYFRDMLAEGERARLARRPGGHRTVSASACLGSEPVVDQEVDLGGNGRILEPAGRVRGGAGRP